MLSSFVGWILTGTIILSSAYTASQSFAIWHQYSGTYKRLLVGVALVSALFGVAHSVQIVMFSHGLFITMEIVALICLLISVAKLKSVHPRLQDYDGEIK